MWSVYDKDHMSELQIKIEVRDLCSKAQKKIEAPTGFEPIDLSCEASPKADQVRV